MEQELEKILKEALAELSDTASDEQVEAVRVRVLGRSGELTQIMAKLREVAPEQRPALGRLANRVKAEIEARIEAIRQARRRAQLEDQLRQERIDVTLPGARHGRGRLHPLTLALERMLDIFVAMGFEVIATPDIEDDFHNFAALNFPPDHPAREMQETFFLPGGLLLRTHTSNGQIRVMEQRKPPLAVICPGDCFRRDELSVRASPHFQQIEGFMVDQAGRVTMAHLKGVLTEFARAFFGSETAIRFRASFFPFTEPSAELDIACLLCGGSGCSMCKHGGWLEILGCGMIHPNVLRAVGLEPTQYQGFAFGLGVERTALLKLGVDDMRLFFENDLRFLEQFPARSGVTI